MTASLYQTWARGDPRAFCADAAGYQVGDLIFNQAELSPARFWRDPDHLHSEGKDFLVLQAQLAGEESLLMPHGQVRLLPGHIYLRDWAYEFDSEATAMRLRSIIVPRHRLQAGAALHAQNPILSWSMAEPAGRHLWML